MQEPEAELSFEELIESLAERLQDVTEPNAVDLRLEELHEVTRRLQERLDEEEVHLLEDDYSAKSRTRTQRGTTVKRHFVIEFFLSVYRLIEALLQELVGKRQMEEDADEDMGIQASQLRSFARHDSFITQKLFWERIDDVKGDVNVASNANADIESFAMLRSSHQSKSHRRRLSWLRGDANFLGSTELSHAPVDGVWPTVTPKTSSQSEEFTF
uniref:Uncharacterized protein n=2 Tax=Rhodosorus marinus TaxID=101924 RepID=A0A7S0BIQ7_9RHOD|mmetsp:Transcript_18196/g.26362  ORF Transcript_18196/g.26362 Transcript_18196/m.26362 type:complete len:214 (+) Transcript_18196:149-790(+)